VAAVTLLMSLCTLYCLIEGSLDVIIEHCINGAIICITQRGGDDGDAP